MHGAFLVGCPSELIDSLKDFELEENGRAANKCLGVATYFGPADSWVVQGICVKRTVLRELPGASFSLFPSLFWSNGQDVSAASRESCGGVAVGTR